ncbi:hypothetical protein EJB05_34384 [Eragrostis curvula]|uniref:Uncharacterized protein n=1 Tax=Eragrostis curvula TaxID=38414 RepID=A0A5J9U417_9POAL|nr:hypothetical protein EJB05_34384 [Eragrostis curvula]
MFPKKERRNWAVFMGHVCWAGHGQLSLELAQWFYHSLRQYEECSGLYPTEMGEVLKAGRSADSNWHPQQAGKMCDREDNLGCGLGSGPR